ncbi:collagen-like protein [Aquimarina aquimarini]|uniref:collagen-like protein n=1 Tax=Aquimarina aquimarini TaxID=1191734 RepID=UPI000D551CC4|nr:collagen-like protein [Aquimarina aquimarini]
MKTKRLKLQYFFLAIITLLTFSCSDGEDGAVGPTGPQGVNGQDGTNGQNGTDGQDGNANVQSFTYDLASVSDTFHDQNVPEISQEVIDNDVVLGYLKPAGTDRLYPIPNTNLTPLNIDVRVFINLERYSMDFYNRNANTTFSIAAGELDELRVVIIESTNKSSGQNILSQLKLQGVDINDYYQVMKHYNLTY